MDFIRFLIQFFIFILLLGIPIIAIFLLYRVFQGRKKLEWLRVQEFVLLKILVPRENEKTPLAAEQMFASLHGILRPKGSFQEHLSFEITAKEKYIEFFTFVPLHLKDFVEGQIYAQYPTAEIIKVPDYTQEIPEKSLSAGTEITLTKNEVFPIKTFPNFEVDPLAGITGVLSKLEPGEQIWIQILIRPVSDVWQTKGMAYVKAVREGKSPIGIISHLPSSIVRFVSDLIKTLFFGPPVPSRTQPITLSGTIETSLKAVEEKATKLGFATKIRILAIAESEKKASFRIETVAGAFKQFNLLNLNGFQVGKITTGGGILSDYRARFFQDNGFILNIEELASIFHLPNVSVQTPTIVWAGAKKGEPPANLPIRGEVPEEDLTVFGKTDFRHIITTFGIKSIDRRHHMYLIGKTGVGKTTMLENMVIDDLREGRGVGVVDPHGDFVEFVLSRVPSNRINDVILFDPSDFDYPIAFNLLENVDPDYRNIVASGLIGIFKKIWGDISWGPRLEYILRNVILSLMAYPHSTLLSVMRILVDKDYRRKVLEKVADPVLRDFWLTEYEKYDPKFRTEAIAPIQNKVGQFLSSPTIRNIIGQLKSSINIREIMDQKKILLVTLPIGKIGEDNSALLGAMMITKIQLESMTRVYLPEEERIDFYLYVDEFQNFATEAFATILSEARKYHLNIILANQYIAQMPEAVRDAIFGNIGTIISFRIGAQDAPFLSKEYAPVFDDNDLVNLDKYHIYIKMSIDGVTCPAFSAITLPPDQNTNQNKEKIIRVSRERYAKSRDEVEEEIIEQTRLEEEEIKEKPQPKVRIEKRGGEEYEVIEDIEGKEWYLPSPHSKTKNQNSKTKDIPESPKKEISPPIKQGGKVAKDLKLLKEGEVVEFK